MDNGAFENAEGRRTTQIDIGWDDRYETNLPLSWEDLEASVSQGKNVKQILHKTSGIAEGGKLTAIMGPSGAGKSSLMNVLARRNLGGIDISGITRVNGHAYTSRISNISSYVQQDDIFIGTLTVREYITFIVRLRLSKKPKFIQDKRIDDLIAMMSLVSCQHALIGQPGLTKTISGGEMKRLSIACGMATNPSFLFLDEPTSGLDTSLAFDVISLLKQLTKRGTTVLCTIHQPSSEIFQMFDNLILLSLGRRIYEGQLTNAKLFFDSQGLPCQGDYNPADHFIWETSISLVDVDETTKKINALADAFEVSSFEKTTREQIKSTLTTSTTNVNIFNGKHSQPEINTQLKMLFWRAFKAKYTNKTMIGLQIQQNFMTALVYGLVFLRVPHSTSAVPYDSDDRYALQGCTFGYIFVNSFQHFYGVLFVFPQLKKIFRREIYDRTYNIGPAVIAQFITDIPYFVLIPCMTSTIVYFMAGYMSGVTVFLNMWGSLMLNIFCASGLGYLLSSVAETVAIANTIASPIFSILLLFSGFFIQASRIPVYFFWIKYLSWYYYSIENIFIGQWTFFDTFVCEADAATQTQINHNADEMLFSVIKENLLDPLKRYRPNVSPQQFHM